MKICFVTQTFPLAPSGGTAHFMFDLVKGFATLNHLAIVVLPFHPQLDVGSFLKQKIRLLPFRYIWPDRFHLLGFGRTLVNDQKLPFSAYLLSPAYYFFGFITLIRAIIREKPDIISAHWIIPGGFIAAAACLFTHTPLVITLPGSDVYLSSQNLLFRCLTRFAIIQAAAIVSDSPLQLSKLAVKGSIIQYPVPPNLHPRKSNPKPVIAAAGRIVEKKGFHFLKDIKPIIEIISGLTITQFRKKLASVDILIAPSQKDTKGNIDDSAVVVLEAMAAGCAVITSDLPGYRLIIKSGTNGLLRPSDKKALQKAVNLLINTPSLRAKLGRRARKTIIRSHTPEKIAARYLDIFSKLTGLHHAMA